MKTGRDANRSGSYISECCLTEITILQSQMFPRCPACLALTTWESVEQARGYLGGDGAESKSIRGDVDIRIPA